MKPILSVLFICLVQLSYAQQLFDYEQKTELPADYERRDIQFTNPEDGVELSGTLIYPNQEFDKVVIIVPGSGKDTRHSHFDLAKAFLLHQIAVYRFDDRGIGKSGGRQNETASSLAKDVTAAFVRLKSLTVLANKKIGILGHSLGGIASISALEKGCDFDFLIQMATPIENNGAFLQYQASTNAGGFYRVKGKAPEEVIQFIEAVRKAVAVDDNYKTTKKKVKAIIKRLDFRKGRHIIDPVIVDLMQQNHEETYRTSEAPILYIIGSQDKVVSSENEIQVLERLDNPSITISQIDDADHYLNDTTDAEEQHLSPYRMKSEALHEIMNWALAQ